MHYMSDSDRSGHDYVSTNVSSLHKLKYIEKLLTLVIVVIHYSVCLALLQLKPVRQNTMSS